MNDIELSPLAIWPAQHRAALVVAIHVDAPGQHAELEGIEVGLDYTATGLPRLLRICDDLGIQATTAWTARALASHPQLARSAHERGHEVAESFVTGERIPHRKPSDELIVKITGLPATGYVESLPVPVREAFGSGAPGSRRDADPLWVISSAGGDTPVIVRDAESGESKVQIPVSPFWMDLTWLHPHHPAPPSSLLETWSASLSSVRAEGGLMTIVLHPHIAGRPGFADAIVRFLDEAIASGDVWIARADHLALWWKSNSDTNP